VADDDPVRSDGAVATLAPSPEPDPNAIVEVRNVKKYFPIMAGVFSRHVADVKAVDDVSFAIKPGETLGLVGESGSGKTTIGRCILRLLEPTSGHIFFEREEITKLPQSPPLWDRAAPNMRTLRSKMQIIFQDPYASLNPRMTVGDIVGEPLQIHGIDGQRHPSRSQIEQRVNDLLRTVKLAPYHANRYPHEFSGGQRQRIGIARALAVNPKFIVADEPVSALDVSIQAQVVNLLQDLQQQLGLTYLFIAHDLSVVRHISDRVAVMYVGKLVEVADQEELYKRPLHPYTQSLLSAIPIPDPRVEARRTRIILTGDIPSPVNPPKACRFNTRCPIAYERCFIEEPLLKDYGAHRVACHKVEELGGQQPDITKRTATAAIPAV
jgi:oligopeptide transport system ATP-binding protein